MAQSEVPIYHYAGVELHRVLKETRSFDLLLGLQRALPQESSARLEGFYGRGDERLYPHSAITRRMKNRPSILGGKIIDVQKSITSLVLRFGGVDIPDFGTGRPIYVSHGLAITVGLEDRPALYRTLNNGWLIQPHGSNLPLEQYLEEISKQQPTSRDSRFTNPSFETYPRRLEKDESVGRLYGNEEYYARLLAWVGQPYIPAAENIK